MPATKAGRSTGIGSTKLRKVSGASAGTVYASGMVTTTSGVPSRQPAGQAGRGGTRLGSPAGAPASAHRRNSATSRSERRREPMNGPPKPGSGFHGGM